MKNGPYILVIAPPEFPGKKYRGRYAYEHIVIYWRHTKMVPEKGYEIHHLNGNHIDNRFDNFLLVTTKQHRRLHGTQKSLQAQITLHCGWCSKELNLLKSVVKTRMKRNKTTKIFCDYSCSAKHQHFMVRTGGG